MTMIAYNLNHANTPYSDEKSINKFGVRITKNKSKAAIAGTHEEKEDSSL